MNAKGEEVKKGGKFVELNREGKPRDIFKGIHKRGVGGHALLVSDDIAKLKKEDLKRALEDRNVAIVDGKAKVPALKDLLLRNLTEEDRAWAVSAERESMINSKVDPIQRT